MMMAQTLRVGLCMLATVGGVAPPVAVPPPARPVASSGAAVSQMPAGAYTGNAVPAAVGSAVNVAPRLRGQPPIVPTHAGWQNAEAALKQALSSTVPTEAAMYYQAESRHTPTISSGDPSVAALLDIMESANPPPATFDNTALLGVWSLEYTNDLPAMVKEEVEKHVEDPVMDLSVVMSVGETGAMETTATVLLASGTKRVTSWHNEIAQINLSPVFLVSDQEGTQMSSEVTYKSDDLLVMRNDYGNLGQVLTSNGLPPSSPKTDVWKKIQQPTSETQAAAGTSLWRFGLRYDLLRENQFEHPQSQYTAAAAIAGLAPLAAAQPASAFDSVVAMLQAWLVGGSVLTLIFGAVLVAATANPLTKRRQEVAKDLGIKA